MEQEKKERGQYMFHPLQDIGQLFLCLYNGMKKGVHGIGMLISFMKQNVCDRLEDRQLRQRNQRDRKQILRMEDEQSQQVRDILFPRNARTGQHATMIILFATFALQLISLTTTYRGARYYLLDLNPLAPFLFALVVQILLFYFSKQAGQHAHMKPTRYMIFLVIVCISVLTSYVGIINNTISPLNDYKNQYKEYQSSFAAAKDELRTLYGDYVSYERIEFLAESGESADTGHEQLDCLHSEKIRNLADYPALHLCDDITAERWRKQCYTDYGSKGAGKGAGEDCR